jgi:hypothetical protein
MSTAWATHAPALAEWSGRLLVNRRDVWGGYYAVNSGGEWATCQTTHPLMAERGKRLLGLPDLLRHFRATSTRDVLGLHTTSADNLSRWGAVDIDNHGEQSPDPAANLAAALAWYERLVALGFRPLLTESNGRGGYHLRVIFLGPVPTRRVYGLMRWLVNDHAAHGLSAPPETFPKQAGIRADRYGNWLRLIGRHHTYPHWPAVWDGTSWQGGEAAVAFVLGLAGDPARLIPAEARACEPPRVVVTVRFVPAHPPRQATPLDRRIRAYMGRLPHLCEGQGRDNVAYSFACWLVRDLGLSDDQALPWLSEWDAGNAPPKGADRLREVLGNARVYGKHPFAGGHAS